MKPMDYHIHMYIFIFFCHFSFEMALIGKMNESLCCAQYEEMRQVKHTKQEGINKNTSNTT